MKTDAILTEYSRMILHSCENAAPWWQNVTLTKKGQTLKTRLFSFKATCN